MLYRESVPKHTLELLDKLTIPTSELGFYLAGGTALALRLGHRVSEDLDFFKRGDFSVDVVVGLVKDLAKKVIILNRSEYSVSMVVDNTKVEFLRYDYASIEQVEENEGVVMCSFIDNALMKLSALTGRGAKKDFADIDAILKIKRLPELLLEFQNKFPESDVFMVIKSLTWFEDANNDPDPIMLIDSDWTQIKKSVEKAVNDL